MWKGTMKTANIKKGDMLSSTFTLRQRYAA